MTPLTDRALASLRDAADWPAADPGRYEILELLGRGGMGSVWRAHDLALGREVALKVLAVDIAREEARVLAQLEHPGIVPVHDAGTLEDGRAFYTMKLVRGERLDSIAAGLPLNDLLRILERVCEALAFAHARGIAHRDLKPANIMLGQFGEVLVLDWGLAVRFGENAPVEPSAGPATVRAGTPGFMAPEQESGARVDARSDIWALGATLLSLVGNRMPRRLSAIAARARAAAPEDRYQEVTHFAAELRRFAAGEPVAAYQERLHERAARLFLKFQTPILLVLAYVLVRALLIIF